MKHIFASILLCLSTFAFAQNPSKASVKALNNYVQFTNESIHGMMIAHRIFENINQEVNRSVDFPSEQINFYGNKDLPKNIFLDPEKWFYQISPYEWFKIAKTESRFLKTAEGQNLNAHADKIKDIIDRTNNLRFQLDDFIKNQDLQDPKNQTEIFRQMEVVVDLYESFYLEKEQLRKDLNKIYQKNYYKETPHKSLGVPVLTEIHNNILPILKSLRYDVSGNLPEYIKKLESNIKKLNEIVNINARYKTAKIAAKKFLTELKKYQNSNQFDSKYKLYGKAYYYHNVELVAAFNNYSGRMIKSLNDLIKLESDYSLFLLEEPHILKVIYPEKEIQKPDNQPIVGDIPMVINDRNVVVRQQNIVVDKTEFTLQFFDHKEQDGDIISINLNGKWIIENQELKNRPLQVKIKLNPAVENYIILHAENLGKIPPNTCAITYYFNGRKKQVVLNSNLNESEMIRMEYVERKRK
ncbi:MAG: hypothetical protein AB8H03_24430 [Saprospiraceae bacterium]